MFTLGRKIDLTYKTNTLIALLSLFAAALGWIVTKEFLSGLSIGVGVFLTWALSRELDPRHAYSALLAALFSCVNLFYYENIQLLVLTWLLLLMRIVNGITGKERTAFDFFSVLGLSLYLSITNQNSVFLLLFSLAMLFLVKASEKTTVALLASGVSFLVFLVETFFVKYVPISKIDTLHPLNTSIIGLFCLSFVFFWFLSKEEVEDDQGKKVKRAQLFSSQLLYSLAVLLLFFFGEISTNTLLIYSSVLAGVTLFFIGVKVLKKDSSL